MSAVKKLYELNLFYLKGRGKERAGRGLNKSYQDEKDRLRRSFYIVVPMDNANDWRVFTLSSTHATSRII